MQNLDKPPGNFALFDLPRPCCSFATAPALAIEIDHSGLDQPRQHLSLEAQQAGPRQFRIEPAEQRAVQPWWRAVGAGRGAPVPEAEPHGSRAPGDLPWPMD